jgi:hypothetical protein
VSDAKSKSTIRQLLESGPTDPLLLDKLSLLEQLRAAHAKNDQKTMLEIGRKLAANEKQIDAAKEHRRAAMANAVSEAKAVSDPDERTKKLLAAFVFCVKSACAAEEEGQDIDTYNFGIRQLSMIDNALRAIPPNRFDALAQFLDSADTQVRGFAAVWLKDDMPERVLPILKEINKTEKFGSGVGTQVFTAIFELESKKPKQQSNAPPMGPNTKS